MMNFITTGDNAGNEITIDPNDVRLSDAGNNLLVATYSAKDLDRGNTEPVFINFHCLRLEDKDRAFLEGIFKLEKAAWKIRQKNKKRKRKNKETFS